MSRCYINRRSTVVTHCARICARMHLRREDITYLQSVYVYVYLNPNEREMTSSYFIYNDDTLNEWDTLCVGACNLSTMYVFAYNTTKIERCCAASNEITAICFFFIRFDLVSSRVRIKSSSSVIPLHPLYWVPTTSVYFVKEKFRKKSNIKTINMKNIYRAIYANLILIVDKNIEIFFKI